MELWVNFFGQSTVHSLCLPRKSKTIVRKSVISIIYLKIKFPPALEKEPRDSRARQMIYQAPSLLL